MVAFAVQDQDELPSVFVTQYLLVFEYGATESFVNSVALTERLMSFATKEAAAKFAVKLIRTLITENHPEVYLYEERNENKLRQDKLFDAFMNDSLFWYNAGSMTYGITIKELEHLPA